MMNGDRTCRNRERLRQHPCSRDALGWARGGRTSTGRVRPARGTCPDRTAPRAPPGKPGPGSAPLARPPPPATTQPGTSVSRDQPKKNKKMKSNTTQQRWIDIVGMGTILEVWSLKMRKDGWSHYEPERFRARANYRQLHFGVFWSSQTRVRVGCVWIGRWAESLLAEHRPLAPLLYAGLLQVEGSAQKRKKKDQTATRKANHTRSASRLFSRKGDPPPAPLIVTLVTDLDVGHPPRSGTASIEFTFFFFHQAIPRFILWPSKKKHGGSVDRFARLRDPLCSFSKMIAVGFQRAIDLDEERCPPRSGTVWNGGVTLAKSLPFSGPATAKKLRRWPVSPHRDASIIAFLIWAL